MEMGFEASGKESTLSTAVAVGKSVAENVPIAKPGAQPGDTRILHSEVIHLKMRSGGQEIESVETDGAATMDFLPNRPGLPKRVMTGDKVWIKYGEDNRIESFRAVNVSTRTDKPRRKGKACTSAGVHDVERDARHVRSENQRHEPSGPEGRVSSTTRAIVMRGRITRRSIRRRT